MNKFNKSNIALLLALTSVFTGNNKSNASLVGDICDITAVATSNVSAGLAMKSKSTAGTVVATVSAIGLPIIFFTGGYFWNQKVKRDKLADSIISSLRNKGKLTNIRKSLEKSKVELDKMLKQSSIAFNGKDIEIVTYNPEAFNEEMVENYRNNLFSGLVELLSETKNQTNNKVIEEKAENFYYDNMKNLPGVEFNTQLNLDLQQKILIPEALNTLIQSCGSAVDALNKDYNFHQVCRNSGVPLSISVCKNEQGKLSSVYSMNFDITDSLSYSNRHNICFRMSDKFELLIDGHSYDIDKMLKK
ncbi:MAG: hypothetical protein IJQ10_00470 [Clostridia bacterium]|nr:hypothetical protein [Clostridia bacterium]